MPLQLFANPGEVLEVRTQAWSPVMTPEVVGAEFACVLLSRAGVYLFAQRQVHFHAFILSPHGENLLRLDGAHLVTPKFNASANLVSNRACAV